MKLDPKIAFFLKHEQQIKEWIGLKERMHAEAHRFLSALAPAVESLAKTLPSAARSFVDLEQPYCKLFLFRESWLGATGKPRVAIGLEWQASKASFRESWTGVWVDHKQDGRSLGESIEAETRSMRTAKHWRKPEAWWPVWRYETPPDDGFLEDLNVLREHLLKSIAEQWTAFHPIVDRVMASQ